MAVHVVDRDAVDLEEGVLEPAAERVGVLARGHEPADGRLKAMDGLPVGMLAPELDGRPRRGLQVVVDAAALDLLRGGEDGLVEGLRVGRLQDAVAPRVEVVRAGLRAPCHRPRLASAA